MSKEPNVIVSNEPWKKPLPNIDKDNEAFYEGLKKHKFLVWRCKKCGASYWPKAYLPEPRERAVRRQHGMGARRAGAARSSPSTATTWRSIRASRTKFPTSMR